MARVMVVGQKSGPTCIYYMKFLNQSPIEHHIGVYRNKPENFNMWTHFYNNIYVPVYTIQVAENYYSMHSIAEKEIIIPTGPGKVRLWATCTLYMQGSN